MKNLIFILAIILVASTVNAQEALKFGQVPESDMTMTIYGPDSSAHAVVLSDKTHAEISIRGEVMLVYYHHIRIKILNKAAFDIGTIKLPYAPKGGENISSLKAHTLNWENGKVIKTPVNKKNIFTEKINKYYKAKKFTFPNLKEGSIIEYKYQFSDEYYYSVKNHYFQREIPVRWSEFSTILPDFFQYRYDFNDSKLPLAINSKTRENVRLSGNSSPGFKYHFAMQNVPALKEEPFITTMNDYRAALRMHLSKYTPSYGLHQTFISNWNSLNYTFLKNYKKYYTKRSGYSNAYKAHKTTIEGSQSAKEKMIALYDAVSSTIIWDEDYDPMPTQKNLNAVYKKKEGTSCEINMLLLALLQEAEIEANPVLISTRKHGRTMSIIPFVYQFDHLIVKASIDGKEYFLDAINPNRAYDLLSFQDMNVEGWLIGDPNGQWINLPVMREQVAVMPEWEMTADGGISGKVNLTYKGFKALNAHQMVRDDKDKFIDVKLKKELEDAEITDTEFKDNTNKDNRLSMSFNIESSSFAEASGDLIYFSPVCMTDFKENPFKSETRTFPVDFGRKINETYSLKLKLPEGYDLETVPKPSSVSLPEKTGYFKFIVQKTPQGDLNIISRISINRPVFPATFYPYLRQFFDIIAETQNQQIVLKKVP